MELFTISSYMFLYYITLYVHRLLSIIMPHKKHYDWIYCGEMYNKGVFVQIGMVI